MLIADIFVTVLIALIAIYHVVAGFGLLISCEDKADSDINCQDKKYARKQITFMYAKLAIYRLILAAMTVTILIAFVESKNG